MNLCSLYFSDNKIAINKIILNLPISYNYEFLIIIICLILYGGIENRNSDFKLIRVKIKHRIK